jgi:hypothetical protein
MLCLDAEEFAERGFNAAFFPGVKLSTVCALKLAQLLVSIIVLSIEY